MRENVASGLPLERRRALEVLVSGGSTAEAAKVAGVSPRSVERWLHEETFRAALMEAQREVTADLFRRLRTLGAQATETLGEVMTNRAAPAGARVSGAKSVLDSVFRITEIEKLDELEQRVKALEERLEERNERT